MRTHRTHHGTLEVTTGVLALTGDWDLLQHRMRTEHQLADTVSDLVVTLPQNPCTEDECTNECTRHTVTVLAVTRAGARGYEFVLSAPELDLPARTALSLATVAENHPAHDRSLASLRATMLHDIASWEPLGDALPGDPLLAPGSTLAAGDPYHVGPAMHLDLHGEIEVELRYHLDTLTRITLWEPAHPR